MADHQEYILTCPRCGELPGPAHLAIGANGNLWCNGCFYERDERHDVMIQPRPPALRPVEHPDVAD